MTGSSSHGNAFLNFRSSHSHATRTTLDPLSRYLWMQQLLSHATVFSLVHLYFLLYVRSLPATLCFSKYQHIFFLAFW